MVWLEAKLFAIDLPANGSLYYAGGLPPGTHRIEIPDAVEGLCVGPHTTLEWWYKERGALGIDRSTRKYQIASWHNFTILTYVDVDARLVLQALDEKVPGGASIES
jgi:hypothetical protein